MRLIGVDALKETLDKIPARSIENADGRAYVLIRLSTVFEIIKQMPSEEPQIIQCKDCKWWTKHDTTLQGKCRLHNLNPMPEWYCASGEVNK